MRKLTKEWLKASADDLMIIEKIITDEHLTHMVAFHSQQAIEKVLKALLEEDEIEIPKAHKISKLFKEIQRDVGIVDYEIVEILDQLYIDSRYPGDLGLLPNGKPTIEKAKGFYEFAQNIFDEVCDQLTITPSDITGGRK